MNHPEDNLESEVMSLHLLASYMYVCLFVSLSQHGNIQVVHLTVILM